MADNNVRCENCRWWIGPFTFAVLVSISINIGRVASEISASRSVYLCVELLKLGGKSKSCPNKDGEFTPPETGGE